MRLKRMITPEKATSSTFFWWQLSEGNIHASKASNPEDGSVHLAIIGRNLSSPILPFPPFHPPFGLEGGTGRQRKAPTLLEDGGSINLYYTIVGYYQGNKDLPRSRLIAIPLGLVSSALIRLALGFFEGLIFVLFFIIKRWQFWWGLPTRWVLFSFCFEYFLEFIWCACFLSFQRLL
jgi:hypothetical protein